MTSVTCEVGRSRLSPATPFTKMPSTTTTKLSKIKPPSSASRKQRPSTGRKPALPQQKWLSPSVSVRPSGKKQEYGNRPEVSMRGPSDSRSSATSGELTRTCSRPALPDLTLSSSNIRGLQSRARGDDSNFEIVMETRQIPQKIPPVETKGLEPSTPSASRMNVPSVW